MKITTPRFNKLSWLFILLYFTPSFIFVYFKQSSLSAGIVVVSFLIIITNISTLAKMKISRVELLLFILSIFFLFIESSYSFIHNEDIKPIMSIPVIFLMFFSAWILSLKISNTDEVFVKKSLKITLYFFLFFGWLAVFRTIEIGNYALKEKNAFPFSEDSHYALCAGFLSCIVGSVSSKKEKFFILVNIGLQAILFPNLTLLVYSIICCFLFWFSRRFLTLASITLIFFIFGAVILQSMQGTLAGDYFLSRVDLSQSSNNLTTLVFLQGIDDSIRALFNTYGAGLGFQRAGTDASGNYGLLIQSITGSDFNRTDGGFLASKIITELGIIGLIISIMYFLQIFKSVKKYNTTDNLIVKMSASAIVAFSIEFFLRGYGYFSPSLLLVIALAISARRLRKNKIS